MALNKKEVDKFLDSLSDDDRDYFRSKLGGNTDDDLAGALIDLGNRVKALEGVAAEKKEKKEEKPESFLTKLLKS